MFELSVMLISKRKISGFFNLDLALFRFSDALTTLTPHVFPDLIFRQRDVNFETVENRAFKIEVRAIFSDHMPVHKLQVIAMQVSKGKVSEGFDSSAPGYPRPQVKAHIRSVPARERASKDFETQPLH